MPRKLVLVGALMIGCAGAPPAARRIETTPPARLAWLKAELLQADVIARHMRGAYVPRGVPGGDIVCSLAVEIDAWYGAGDEKWELTNANLRAELARLGVRDCVLDLNR